MEKQSFTGGTVLILSQSFYFDAAHTLIRTVPLEEFTPSTRIHGHTYKATVSIKGEVGESGMLETPRNRKHGPRVHDLFYFKEMINTVREKLDHHFLDEVEGLGKPTLENLCSFIYKNLAEQPIYSVKVERESSGDACELNIGAKE
jgi:6-pyruvoyltetrahydropterin/6-carboxytetrahydropterin synthase